MKFFTVKTDEQGTKKILYPLSAITKISEDLNPDFSSEYTKITLNNGEVLNVCESTDEIQKLLNDNNLNEEDFVLTAYRPISKRIIHNN